jgi:hypothetical protein
MFGGQPTTGGIPQLFSSLGVHWAEIGGAQPPSTVLPQ